MRIAIATEGVSVSEHFGRCAVYTVLDIVDHKIVNEIKLENPGHSPGAIPEFLKSNQVDLVITGGIGGRAIGFFDSLGIGVISGVSGLIDDVTNDYLLGILKSGEGICQPGAGKGYGIDKNECDHGNEGHSH
ncbi:MAG: NifB/NifX family molybdenum-iron cluster-binding protein [Clostridia bacterium]|nr:NifB/NifX family molybdenum-iron cluster-binding protein [Clostridia bacterium]